MERLANGQLFNLTMPVTVDICNNCKQVRKCELVERKGKTVRLCSKCREVK
jgi:hypothetical protein